MRKTLIFLLFVLVVVPYSICSFAHLVNNYISQRYTTLDGLSQNDVNCIIQDSEGFLWIGTNDGLNRFDGYNFKYYGIGYKGLSSIIIMSLAEDIYGNIWIGTSDKGLYCYNKSTDSFTHIAQTNQHEMYKRCPIVRATSDGYIWAYYISNNEICKIDCLHKNIVFSCVLPMDLIKGGPQRLKDIVILDKEVLLCAYNGVYQLTEKGAESFDLTKRIDGAKIYVGAKENRIFLLSPEQNEIFFYDKNFNLVTSIKVPEKVNKAQYVKDEIIFTNNDGSYKISVNPTNNLYGRTQKISNIKTNVVPSILIDNKNNIWIANLGSGITFIKKSPLSLRYFNEYGNNHVSQIKSEGNDLYVATSGYGLYKTDIKKGVTEHIGLDDQTVFSLEISDYDKNIYASVYNKLYCISPDKSEKLFLSTGYVIRKILADERFLWIAQYMGGIIRYDLSTNEQINISEKDGLLTDVIRNFIKDSKGNIWIATDCGVAVISAETKNSLSPKVENVSPADNHEYVIPLFADANDNIWYGTLGEGLHCLSKDKDGEKYLIKSFNENNGLTNNCIKAIQQDIYGNIWVSTNKGLNCIEKSTDKVYTFELSDGLQDYEFNELSSTVLDDGRLVFGGINGINLVNPNASTFLSRKSNPVITDVKISNRSINDYPEYIQSTTGKIKSICLPYNMNNITFEFSSLNFSHTDKMTFMYMLDGTHQTWSTTLRGQHSVNYTSLSPGNYVFKVKTNNLNGTWGQEVSLVNLKIAPPFWLSWYAYIFYFIILVIWIYVTKEKYKKRIAVRNKIYIANYEKQKSEELLEEKTIFFTNISHEIRTPLTLIFSPLQTLYSRFSGSDNETKELLDMMKHNGVLLMKLVNELMNFSKEENGKLKINLQEGDLKPFSKGIFKQFDYWAEQKGIHLEYSISGNDFRCFYDPFLMEEIIYNLVSNAIKHTSKEGFVSFRLADEGENIAVSVADSGKGLEPELAVHIFEKFYTNNKGNNSTGTGIGLYLTKRMVELHNGTIDFVSKPNVGTVFTFTFPKFVGTSLSHLSATSENTVAQQIPLAPISSGSTDVVVNDTPEEVTNDSFDDCNKKTLLIVDDNEEILKVLEVIFSDKYIVKEAADGLEALKIMAELQPDLLISDVMMPNMNGLELCEKVKSQPETSHIPVILLTAKSDSEDMIVGYKFRADLYCTKPFNNSLLEEMVASTLDNHERYRKIKLSLDGISEDSISNSTDEKLIKQLIQTVEDNVSNSNFSVNDLSASVGLTSIILNKKLKVLFNMTANSFIRKIRLRRAATLLKSGKYNVSEVTYDVGFNDLKYFRDCFKKEYGMLPQKYKEENMVKEEPLDLKTILYDENHQ